MTSTQFSEFWNPSPLVCILARFIVLKSRNLPYYVCIWVTPSPSLCRHHLSMTPCNTWRGFNSPKFFPSGSSASACPAWISPSFPPCRLWPRVISEEVCSLLCVSGRRRNRRNPKHLFECLEPIRILNQVILTILSNLYLWNVVISVINLNWKSVMI